MQQFELLGQVSDVKNRTRTGEIIGPQFFWNEAGAAVLVNRMRYRTMIEEFLRPQLEDMDVNDAYFQIDGATCHASSETIGLLRVKFPGRLISWNGNYNWLPRSCDLTPLDFFLFGYVEDKVYVEAPQSIQELKEKIRAIIDKIEPQMCENVMENFIIRTWSCKGSRGGHMNDIDFHY